MLMNTVRSIIVNPFGYISNTAVVNAILGRVVGVIIDITVEAEILKVPI